MIEIDRDWCIAHPLPDHGESTDKNARGRVLAAGGGLEVPGGLALTGEAALRAGAGKVRLASVAALTSALGIAFPEAGVVPLSADDAGEIAAEAADALIRAAERCDTLVLGPAISSRSCAASLVQAVLAADLPDVAILLDAAAVACAGAHEDAVRRHPGTLVLTPHFGEMAALTGEDAAAIEADQAGAAARAATRFGAIVVLKGGETVVAAPDGTILHYRGGGVGLGTGGSGDVLAGVIAGLMSRGTDPLIAAGWGVWLHGEAGRTAADRIGPIGFLARELLPEIPRLMAEH
jgi:hydroxyethylthiazole kinase-like uncharacterized protein yjeF